MSKKTGNFTRLSQSAIRAICEHEPDECYGALLASYIVLCMHTNKDGITYATGNAISSILPRTGRSQARQYYEWLSLIPLLATGELIVQPLETDGKRQYKKIYQGDGDDSFLIPNCFVDAIGKQGASESHLQKILHFPRHLRKIAVSVMLELYAAYDPLSYWGCDPKRSLYGVYEPYSNEDLNIEYSEIVEYGKIFKCYGIDSRTQYSKTGFIKTVLAKPESEISDNDYSNFWAAHGKLEKQGCIFTNAIVFDGCPLTEYADPLYLIYCHQQYKRDNDLAFKGAHSKTLEMLDSITDCRYPTYRINEKAPLWVAVTTTDYNPHLVGIISPLWVAQSDDEYAKQQAMIQSQEYLPTILG